ncbi:MAG: AAA family ATPase [Candidatus ainarchaeum sp.]|nr:AAA family ATPase [Candidatus ainarchaeum sp.]
MLKLRELNIEDFKSFRTLDAKLKDGLTAVVGPNGCGKSNFFDAIIFALGNTSQKKLRYANIEELINKASDTKVAKVSITLEDEKKNETYKISREVSEKGSVFRLNGSRTTLESIVSMLSNYNIYPDGHNFILQDKIKKITEATDLERKKIIDEISDIEKFQDRLDLSKKNLESVNVNVEKINIALREKDEWLTNLRTQKETAERYIELNNKKTTTKAIILKKQKEHTERELAKLAEKIETCTKEIAIFEKELVKLKSETEESELELKNIAKDFDSEFKVFEKIKEQVTKKELTVQNEERELHKLEREIKYLNSDIDSKNQEILGIHKKNEGLEKRISELQEFLRNAIEVPEVKQFTVCNYDRELNQFDNELQINKQKISDLEKNPQELLDKIKESDSIREEIKVVEAEIKNLEIERSTIENNYVEEENVIFIKDETEIQARVDELYSQNRFGTFVFALEDSELEDCELENTKKSGKLYITTLSPEDILSEIDAKIEESNKKIEKIKQDLEIKEQEKEALISKINEERKRKIEEYNSSITSILNKRKNILTEIEKVKKELNTVKQQQKMQEEINNKKIEIEKIKEEIKYKTELIDVHKKEIKKIEKQIEEKNKEELKIKEKINSLNSELVEEKASLNSEKARHEKIKQKKQSLEELIQTNNKKIAELKSNIIINKNHIEIGESETKSKTQLLKEHEEEIESFVRNNKGFIIEAHTKEASKALHLLKAELNTAEEQINTLGPVNHKAIEDYNNLLKEVSEIEEKIKKLEEEKSKVSELLDKIILEKTTTFMSNFNSIKEIFIKNVSELGLGTGDLVLTDKDLDLAGVKITISSKKSKKNLQSLSGGEKALVSIAFILAILQHKPASFYLLDEIDAALDYQNTDKVVKLIKELSKTTQILIISHNTETIKLCDYVLGITKNTRGTSIIGVTKELIS